MSRCGSQQDGSGSQSPCSSLFSGKEDGGRRQQCLRLINDGFSLKLRERFSWGDTATLHAHFVLALCILLTRIAGSKKKKTPPLALVASLTSTPKFLWWWHFIFFPLWMPENISLPFVTFQENAALPTLNDIVLLQGEETFTQTWRPVKEKGKLKLALVTTL